MTETSNGTSARRNRLLPLRAVLRPQVVLPLASLAAFLSAWEAVGRSVNPLLFAPPSRVVGAFIDLLRSGELLTATATTLNVLITGYALAILVGVPLGVVMAQARTFGLSRHECGSVSPMRRPGALLVRGSGDTG